jgi:hypothetical protein
MMEGFCFVISEPCFNRANTEKDDDTSTNIRQDIQINHNTNQQQELRQIGL